MNFYQHQEKAKYKTKKLIFLFILAVISIICAISILTMMLVSYNGSQPINNIDDLIKNFDLKIFIK